MTRRGIKAGATLTLAILLLAVGGAIYLLYRPQTLVLFRVTDTLGLTAAIDNWRATTQAGLPEWVIYSLPNALWTVAYILITDSLTLDEPEGYRLRTAAFIPMLGIVSEALQAAGVIPGTFDWLDLGAYALPYLVYGIIIKSNNNKKNRL